MRFSFGILIALVLGVVAFLVWPSPIDPRVFDAGRQFRDYADFERDGYRCTVPGCTARSRLESHHVTFRAAGGPDVPENRTTLCWFHHHAGVHEGRVRVSGRAPDRLLFELGIRSGASPLTRYRSGDIAV